MISDLTNNLQIKLLEGADSLFNFALLERKLTAAARVVAKLAKCIGVGRRHFRLPFYRYI